MDIGEGEEEVRPAAFLTTVEELVRNAAVYPCTLLETMCNVFFASLFDVI